MGRWSQGEHERQLVMKIKKLFEKSLLDPYAERLEDPRFNTFIRQLDPEDKVIQACFQSLVQHMLYNNARGSRRARASHSPPPMRRITTQTATLPRRRQMALRTVASRRRLNPEISITSPITSHPTSPFPVTVPPALPESPNARRRSPSPSFSPSRARHFEYAAADLDIPAPAQDVPRDASPDLAESRAWLNEYRQGVMGFNNNRPVPSTSENLIENLLNASYGSMPSSRSRLRRQREDEDTGRRVRRRVDPSGTNEDRRDTRRDGLVFESLLGSDSADLADMEDLSGTNDIWDFDLPVRRYRSLREGHDEEDDHLWDGMDGYIDLLPHLEADLESESEYI